MLALQGAFRAHRLVIEGLGAPVREVRTAAALDDVDALIIPGGESTTMSQLLDSSGLRAPLAARLADGMAVLGTCAGAILLASDIRDGREDQASFQSIDVTVRRNAYGRQLASFEADLEVADGAELPAAIHAVFIRAPRIERVGADVRVLAALGSEPVAVASGRVWATTFHPELSDDTRFHRAWLETVAGGAPMLG